MWDWGSCVHSGKPNAQCKREDSKKYLSHRSNGHGIGREGSWGRCEGGELILVSSEDDENECGSLDEAKLSKASHKVCVVQRPGVEKKKRVEISNFT